MSTLASDDTRRNVSQKRQSSADQHGAQYPCCSEEPYYVGGQMDKEHSRRSSWSGPQSHHDASYPPPSRAAWCTQPQRPCGIRPVPVVGAQTHYPAAFGVQPIHAIPVQTHFPGLRPHPYTPAAPLHDIGFGPTPLFGWDSVHSLPHSYGLPKYPKYVKPDYRRFCYSVGKADVPYAALPGGPLYGYPTTLSPQLLGRW